MTSHTESSVLFNLDLTNGKILSLVVNNLFLKVLAHDTLEFSRNFNSINNKPVRGSKKRQQTNIRPTQPTNTNK